jgi:hypothetical protein
MLPAVVADWPSVELPAVAVGPPVTVDSAEGDKLVFEGVREDRDMYLLSRSDLPVLLQQPRTC